MTKFASGLIAGGILGVIGAGVYLSDSKNRKGAIKAGKKVIHKANDFIENATDIF